VKTAKESMTPSAQSDTPKGEMPSYPRAKNGKRLS